MERRRYLKGVAIVGSTATFAGCMDDGGDGNGNGMDDGNGADDTPSATATDTDASDDDDAATETDGMGDPTETPPTDPDQRVAVGDGLSFDPGSFEVSVGDTVLWDWVGNGHNIKYDDGDVPDGTDWDGTEGGRTDTYGEGHTHWHTFETAGEYAYYCVPHRGNGMTGSFTVTE